MSEDVSKIHNLQAERSVLSYIFLDEGNYLLLRNAVQLHHNYFFKKQHREIFHACSVLISQKKVVNLVTASEQLKASYYKCNLHAGGLLDFIDVQTGFTLPEEEARIIIHCHNARNSAELFFDQYTQLVRGYTTDVRELYDAVRAKADELIDADVDRKFQEGTTVAREAVAYIREKINEPMKQGIKTGFPKLDNAIGGFQRGRLYVLAAATSVGKSALSLCFALEAMRQEQTCAFFSLEMRPNELLERVLAIQLKYDSLNLATGRMPSDDLDMIEDALPDVDPLLKFLKIKYQRQMPLARLTQDCRAWAKQNPLGIIIVDYLQLIRGAGTEKAFSREREVANISSELKTLSADLDVPVIALAQLNRNYLTRKNPEPRIGDIRESSGIEHDADCILFLHRDLEPPEDGISEGAECYLKIGKNRQGPCLKIQLNYEATFTRFYEYKAPPPIRSFEESKKIVRGTNPLAKQPLHNRYPDGSERPGGDLPF